MTTAPPPVPPDDVDDRVEPAEDFVGPRPRERSTWWRIGFPVVLVLAVLAIPVLVWVGMRAVLDSSDGQLVQRVSDPAAPGWEAVVEPTPVSMVVSTNAQGGLDSVTVFTDNADNTGGVLQIPAGTVVPLIGDSEVTLRFMYDEVGLDGLRSSVQELLNLTIDDVSVVSSDQWAGLVEPVAPLNVNSPDPVVNAFGTVVYPKGSIELPAAGVWDYLSALGPGASDLGRLVRQQAFWSAWLDALQQAGGASAVPGGPDTPLASMLGSLAGDDIVYSTLPVTPAGPDAVGREQFTPIEEGVADAVAAIVPFPEGAPGVRARLRVLDGTGELDHGVQVALLLAAAGAQVDVVGNARDFDATTTQFVYYEPSRKAEAEALRDALGVGEVVASEQTNAAVDITVVLGADLLDTDIASGSAAPPSTLGNLDGN